MFQQEGLIGHVGIVGVHLALHQGLQVKTGLHQIQLIELDPLTQKGGQQLDAFAEWKDRHQALADQIMQIADIGAIQNQPGDGGVLQDGGESHYRFALCKIANQSGVGNAIISLPAEDGIDGGDELALITVGTQPDLQPCIAIETFFQRHVVTGKLKLMHPLELQRHSIQRRSGSHEQPQHKQDEIGAANGDEHACNSSRSLI